jgi:serine protease Do
MSRLAQYSRRNVVTALIAITSLFGFFLLLDGGRLTAQPPSSQPPSAQPFRAQPLTAQQYLEDVPGPASLADLKDLNERVKTLVNKVRPAVVQVSGGSGVVVGADGLVMCVAHVGVRAGRPVTFTFPDGRRARGITLGNDKMGDASLMRITDKGNWPHVEIAKPEDIKLGEWCLAISYPISFDLQQRHPSVRLGRVYHHCPMDVGSDCTIMGGDSGGPLFDMQGRVIGISSTCGNSVLENRHVSVDRFLRYWDRLLKSEDLEELEPGYGAILGVSGEIDVDEPRLGGVKADGPAAKAGMKAGDVVTKFAGKDIRSFQELTDEVKQHKPGEKVELEYRRGDATVKVSVTLGKVDPK